MYGHAGACNRWARGDLSKDGAVHCRRPCTQRGEAGALHYCRIRIRGSPSTDLAGAAQWLDRLLADVRHERRRAREPVDLLHLNRSAPPHQYRS